MKRRYFLTTTAAAAIINMGASLNIQAKDRSVSPLNKSNKAVKKLDLNQLREQYRKALFEEFIPNMDRFVIDHEYGGFITTVDITSGKQLSDYKRAWYEGRGIWVYSFLYNNFEKNPKYLEIATKSKDFILKHQPADSELWISSFSRKGEPLSGAGDKNPYIAQKGDIYGNLFIAEGLAEYAKASGDRKYFALAKKITLDALAIYDNPEYFYDINYGPSSAPKITGTRVLGHWMVFLRNATQMLSQEYDADIEKLANRCVHEVMERHLNPAYNLLNEGLAHDSSLPQGEWAQFAYLGHGFETLWMVMFEAVRRKDPELLHSSAEAFKRHVQVAHDAVYGGFFRSLDDVKNNKWTLNKMLLFQEEVLIGTLFLVENMQDSWAEDCFAETWKYVQEKFVRPGYKFWIPGGDRTLTEISTERAEHYHHPRHLMLNLLSLERMIKRG